MQKTSWFSVTVVALILLKFCSSVGLRAATSSTAIAAEAVNSFGLDLFRQVAKPDANALISPYSIQSAMVMAYAGADGVTRQEMERVLHYSKDETQTHRSFAALRLTLEKIVSESEKQVAEMKRYAPDAKNDPLTLNVANRLFGQAGYDFRAPFLALLNDQYAAPFMPVDFVRNSAEVANQINDWIKEQTKDRIRQAVSPDAFGKLTRLVLVNAIFLKAGWLHPFRSDATKPKPFWVNGHTGEIVPMMHLRQELAYAKGSEFSVLCLPYAGGQLRFLILLPDQAQGLAESETCLTAEILMGNFNWEVCDVDLQFPKFKIEAPVMPLATQLQSLGMQTAFDRPRGSANFDRITPRRPDDYLYLSAVLHKAWFELDEQGTEAGAGTGAVVPTVGIHKPKKPVQFKVDHPFLFLIQHVESGACLFLGHVTDPR